MKTFRRAAIGLEDLNVGSGTFSRGTSTGATQTMTRISLASLGFTITSITNSDSPYSAAITAGIILANATSGAITINLPTAVGNSGKVLIIKKSDLSGNVVTIDGSGSQTIDQSLTWTLTTPFERIAIVSDGSNWHIYSA